MFPIQKMSDTVFDQIGCQDETGYMQYRSAGDVLVLFKLLEETVIRYADGCMMYKRVHEGNSIGWGDSRKKKITAKLFSELFSPFFTPNLWSFISLFGNLMEKIALILIYPFLVLRLYIAIALYWYRKLRID
jgi:hypothetical protein